MDLEPRAVTYPPYVESERLRGNFTNSDPLIPVKNLMSYDLMTLAPSVHSFLWNFQLDLADHERLDDGPQGDVGAGCSWGFCC